MATKPDTGMRSCVSKQLQRVFSAKKRCVSWCGSRKGATATAAEGRRLSRSLSRPGHIIKIIRQSLVLSPGDAHALLAEHRDAGAAGASSGGAGGQDSMFSSVESFPNLEATEKSTEACIPEPPPRPPHLRERPPWLDSRVVVNPAKPSTEDVQEEEGNEDNLSESCTLCPSKPQHPTIHTHTHTRRSKSSLAGLATSHLASSSVRLRQTEIILIPQPPPPPPQPQSQPKHKPRPEPKRKGPHPRRRPPPPRSSSSSSSRASRGPGPGFRQRLRGLLGRVLGAPSPFLLATMA